jgi:hypothetical protein
MKEILHQLVDGLSWFSLSMFILLFCLGFNHPFGGAGFLNRPQ